MEPAVLLTVDGAIAEIRLNRPQVLNALDTRLTVDFRDAVEAVAERRDLAVVLIRGAGRAFCSGMDLDELHQGTLDPRHFPWWERSLRRLELMDALVVAAIHGYCVGGGLQLALACDLRLVAAGTQLSLPAAEEGLIPGMSVFRLARFVGMGRAKSLILGGQRLDAEQAQRMGLADEVLPTSGFDAAVEERVAALAAGHSDAARHCKRLLDVGWTQGFDEFLRLYLDSQERVRSGPDRDRFAHVYQQRKAQRRARRGSP